MPNRFGRTAITQRTTTLLDGTAAQPTAIIYGSDPMAIAGISAARRCGVAVPEQLSVVGFDGLPIGAWIDPTLTTVQRDAVQRGRAVATKLLALLGEEIEVQQINRPYLVVRGSISGVR